eukprot:3889562-Amphidinium_carterae.1
MVEFAEVPVRPKPALASRHATHPEGVLAADRAHLEVCYVISMTCSSSRNNMGKGVFPLVGLSMQFVSLRGKCGSVQVENELDSTVVA